MPGLPSCLTGREPRGCCSGPLAAGCRASGPSGCFGPTAPPRRTPGTARRARGARQPSRPACPDSRTRQTPGGAVKRPRPRRSLDTPAARPGRRRGGAPTRGPRRAGGPSTQVGSTPFSNPLRPPRLRSRGRSSRKQMAGSPRVPQHSFSRLQRLQASACRRPRSRWRLSRVSAGGRWAPGARPGRAEARSLDPTPMHHHHQARRGGR
mmetsp:Transcript_39718/g.88902  ORF Transcript_39718/g.88902 Transcript_39718/m.88902 type:complete len:208 (-) Transcript_39718:806-1429(-)